MTIAFMRLSLPSGYDVTGSDDGAKARVLTAGRDAEANILSFLHPEHGKAKAYGTVVKILKRMHSEGKLDEHIKRYQVLHETGKTLDDSPPNTIHQLRLSMH
ncbi:hypothetical protein PI124_g6330 [Phytophthora idaei]|nr:hypothetical protein PI125_g8945 [Phytophthora idaei]KAG3173150.1 hypothetical protein PI126_g965 [Phytophthora idaei]KAG3248983.1 hypothetical protein PI124_g6330 [Phytophthora idaei]